MDTKTPKHLITELGVLKSFSIGKRVSIDTIKKYKNKIKNITKTKAEADLLLKQVIQRDSQKMIDVASIPGILKDHVSDPGSGSVKRQAAEKNFVDLTYFASIISKKIADKKMSMFDKCYIVNTLVNILNLSEENFDTFHEIFEKFKSGDIESPED